MKTVLEMALEAGFTSPVRADGYMGLSYDRREGRETGGSLERFAELVRADEREQGQKWFDAVTAQHKQEILAEREACAKVEENMDDMVLALLNVTRQPVAIAAAIRARGQA